MANAKDHAGLVAQLMEARRSQAAFAPAHIKGAAMTIPDAYEVQAAVVMAMAAGEMTEVLGYKIGLTDAGAQARFGISEPIIGRLLRKTTEGTGFVARLGDYARLAVECEIALVIGKSAESATHELNWSDIRSAHAAFELIDDHGASVEEVDAASIIADNGWHAGLILGQALLTPPIPVSAGLSARLVQNGECVANCNQAEILGGPLAAVNWLNAFLGRAGKHLRTGDIVMTGALIGPVYVAESSVLRFEIEGFPAVEFSISDQPA